ncbi:hypothetical protein K2173_021915 [Erythroxylum novogranatense]|uniref:Photosynthetic NDH subcomplex L 2 n=1 Tax=Erythroxylum novogranatense TaxID=1862640 RepID=A0AAV8T2H5_9ROSI|nr:hypothetical protein K2173_021915 [Erythroxylum novogranatense]
MTTITNTPSILRTECITNFNAHSKHATASIRASNSSLQERGTIRRKVLTTLGAVSVAVAQQLGGSGIPLASAQNWGTHSFLKERYFEPDLSPEDSAARIKQTAEGLHSIREMLERMSWRYVLFYIRLKQAYLGKDLRIAMATLPVDRRRDYVTKANELVDNMDQLDSYIRTPKVYESYVYYEKTLKSIDDIVALL